MDTQLRDVEKGVISLFWPARHSMTLGMMRATPFDRGYTDAASWRRGHRVVRWLYYSSCARRPLRNRPPGQASPLPRSPPAAHPASDTCWRPTARSARRWGAVDALRGRGPVHLLGLGLELRLGSSIRSGEGGRVGLPNQPGRVLVVPRASQPQCIAALDGGDGSSVNHVGIRR